MTIVWVTTSELPKETGVLHVCGSKTKNTLIPTLEMGLPVQKDGLSIGYAFRRKCD